MDTTPLSDIASDLEHGGVTKKLAAKKIRDWIRGQKIADKLTPYTPKETPYQWPYVPLPDRERAIPMWPKRGDAVRCPKCGVDFSGVMGYSCQNIDCPMGVGPILCGKPSAGDIKVTFSDGSTHTYTNVDKVKIDWVGDQITSVSVNGRILPDAIHAESVR